MLVVAWRTTLASYTIVDPVSDSTWIKGRPATVRWQVSGEVKGPVTVVLAHGDANQLEAVATVCADVAATALACTFAVPGTLASGVDYAVEVRSTPQYTPDWAFSSYFAVRDDGEAASGAATGCAHNGGRECARDLPCCSAYGYCGATPDFCGAGCQAAHSVLAARARHPRHPRRRRRCRRRARPPLRRHPRRSSRHLRRRHRAPTTSEVVRCQTGRQMSPRHPRPYRHAAAPDG